MQQIPHETLLILVTNDDNDASAVYNRLVQEGYDPTFLRLVPDGLAEWEAAGFELEIRRPQGCL
jgi:hypothetical protein